MTASLGQHPVADRVVAVLTGRRPDRHPFIGRLQLWHASHRRNGTLPADLVGLSLTDIHRAVGMGQQVVAPAFGYRLVGATVTCTFAGETIYRAADPLLTSFPSFAELIPDDRPGQAEVIVTTPVGRLSVHWEVNDQMVVTGTRPYKLDHLIKEDEDYRTVEYLLERAEFNPQFDRCYAEQARLGEIGLVVPSLNRIPFQHLLLEYVGEAPLFYALHDNPEPVHRLLHLLDERTADALRQLAAFDMPYVEFTDNLESGITNPRLFTRYCLPAYRRYAEIVHRQGKKLGSHTDGNVRPLLKLLAESGLDVCESFSPAPLTPCTFEEAWETWRDGPIIWGGIPSPILEARTSEAAFREHISRLLATIGDRPIILCVVDLVMSINSIERIRYIAEQVEAHPL